MKKYVKVFFSFILIIASIIFSSFLWDKIYLPYNNPQEIIGTYSNHGYNPINETIRYLIFIFFPLFTALSCCFFFKREVLLKIKNQIFQKENVFEYKNKRNKNRVIFFIFFIYICLEFFSINFSYKPLDLYHEGQILTSSYNNLLTNGYWSSSYITIGVFFEIFFTSFLWELFGLETVGVARLQFIILNFVFRISLLFFSYQVTKKFVMKENKKILSFVFLSCLLLIFSNFNIWEMKILNYRDLPLILFLIFLVEAIENKIYSNFFVFILGILSVLSILWGLDRGAYLNLALFLFFSFLIFREEKNKIIFLLTGFFLGWIAFFIISGQSEAKFFLENSLSIYQNHGFIDGIIHPIPFSNQPDSWRATKTIISILTCGLLLIYLFVFGDKKFLYNSKILLVFIFIFSLIVYTQALTRSDGPHMRESLGFPIIFLSIYFINEILQIKKSFLNKLNKSLKKFSFLLILFLQIFLLFLMSKFTIGYSRKAYSPIEQTISIEHIKTFKSRFNNFITTSDDFFLDNELKNIVSYYKSISKNDKCVQIFNYDSAISFLVKKKTCTRYYHIWALGSKKNQLKFIAELEVSKPNFILLHGPQDFYGGLSSSERHLYAYDYILRNYSKYKKMNEWIFYERNKKF
jgi:hypothetical protein